MKVGDIAEVRLIAYTPEPEKVVATAANLCYSSKTTIATLQDSLTRERIERLITQIMESRHYSTLEHIAFSFAIESVSRALLAEISRHRIGIAMSVRSQRYVGEESCDFVMPESIHNAARSVEGLDGAQQDAAGAYEDFVNEAQSLYKDLVSIGVPKEDARMVLPNATHTRMIVTMNARELLHFFSLRACTRANHEIRELANQMIKLVRPIAPLIFDKAGPYCKQYGYCPEGSRCCGRAKTIKDLLDLAGEG